VTENEIKAEVRLYALECAVCQLAVTMLAMGGSPFETFAAVRKQMLDGTRNRSFPNVSPAESDLYSAETGERGPRPRKPVSPRGGACHRGQGYVAAPVFGNPHGHHRGIQGDPRDVVARQRRLRSRASKRRQGRPALRRPGGGYPKPSPRVSQFESPQLHHPALPKRAGFPV
jgi:hypothetical protein